MDARREIVFIQLQPAKAIQLVRPYSEDIRTRVVQAYLNGEGSQRQLASRFNVSLGFVKNLLKRYRETGSFEPKEPAVPTSRIDEQSLQLILHLVQDNPLLSLSALCQRVSRQRHLRISRSTMWRIVKKHRPHKTRPLSRSRNNRSIPAHAHQGGSPHPFAFPQANNSH